jgi:hypothetical protein
MGLAEKIDLAGLVEPAAVNSPPVFDAGALTLFVTGSVNAALLPHWLSWLRLGYRRARLKPV